MTNLQAISLPQEALFIEHRTVNTNTLKVAEAFKKRHSDILRRLESLECTTDFSQRNFASAEYLDNQSKPRKMYSMTKDGFMFLVMGFTGKKAAAIKEAYINAFNNMYDALKSSRQTSADERTGLRNAIKKISTTKRITIPDAYKIVHQYMNVEHIDEICKEDVQTAVAYCHKVILEGELVEPELINIPNEPIVLSYPKQPSCMRYLSFREMHDCGWHLNVKKLIGKLKGGAHNSLFMAEDLSGIEHEVDSLLHLIELQRYKLDEIYRISKC